MQDCNLFSINNIAFIANIFTMYPRAEFQNLSSIFRYLSPSNQNTKKICLQQQSHFVFHMRQSLNKSNISSKTWRHISIEDLYAVLPSQTLSSTLWLLLIVGKWSIHGLSGLYWHNIVTCIPIARQRLGKHIPAKPTHAKVGVCCWVTD
jgi:hypothetical protein